MQSSVDLAQKVVEGNRRVEGEVVKGEGLVVVRRQQAGRFQLRYQCSFRSLQEQTGQSKKQVGTHEVSVGQRRHAKPQRLFSRS